MKLPHIAVEFIEIDFWRVVLTIVDVYKQNQKTKNETFMYKQRQFRFGRDFLFLWN